MDKLTTLLNKNPDKFVAYLDQIFDGFFGNLFITWKNDYILYVNQNLASSIHSSKKELTGMPLSELREKKYWLRSVSSELYESGKSFSAYNVSKYGDELYTHVSPVFDADGTLIMGIHYTVAKHFLAKFTGALDQEKDVLRNYRDIVEYLARHSAANVSPVYESSAARMMMRNADEVCGTDSTVLLYGESGTGKEVLAKYIFRNGARASQAFIPVNCAAIPPELLEAELFGYERGAFTGARNQGKPGLFEIADMGTLFLDEIGELPLAMQPKLLRVLESGEAKRIGGTKFINTNVRLIAATNQNLWNMVSEKRFREDLYYRLNVIPIHLPPLRERKDDILPLAEHFLAEFIRKHGLRRELSPQLRERLTNYAWPGNIRELRNILERFVITGNMDIVDSRLTVNCNPCKERSTYTESLKSAMKRYEEQYITKVLEDCGNKVSLAANRLGIHRSVLYRKLGLKKNRNGMVPSFPPEE